jgi:hypothetical protein
MEDEKMNKKRLTLTILSMVVSLNLFTGCALIKPYDKPEFVEISPSETAFLIPMEGQTSDQGKFASEDFVKDNLVAAKRIQIPHKWQQEGRFQNDGRYVGTHRLIKVERKPVAREWTNDSTGTGDKDQAIRAQSKDNIAFSSNFNITAQIDEVDAPRFLYLYSGLQLEFILDNEIRNMVTTKWAELCAKKNITELTASKEDLMNDLRAYILPYFKERGINITSLGLSGKFQYDNAGIQEAIDNTFKKAQELEAQRAENQKNIEKAEAEAKAANIQASTIDQTLKLKELEVQSKLADAEIEKAEAMKEWKNITTITGGGSILQMPATK